MEEQHLTRVERERLTIIRACLKREITNTGAGAKLNLKKRQIQKLKRSVEKHGDRGIVHGNSGRSPAHATDEKTKRKIIAFLKKREHRDFGPTFAAEQLKKQKHITRSRETVRTIMRTHGLWKSKQRSGSAVHREWRERKSMYGELVQFDGSYHWWFENGEEHCLLAAIDDATSRVPHAQFEENEGVHAVFRFWWEYIETHGRPVALYMDIFSTYKVNHKSAVDNIELMTQFTRAMNELDIQVINANSPEAKGRIERLFGTLQDRLVKELRLERVKERSRANRFLADVYLPEHSTKFSVPAKCAGDAHRPLTDDQKKRLLSIFSVQSQRTVTNDFTIRFKNQWYQLAPQQPIAVYRGDVVVTEERLDDSLHLRLKDRYLHFTPIAKLERATRPRVTALTAQKSRWKPPIDHPWRRRKI
jgi:hypothetical protein